MIQKNNWINEYAKKIFDITKTVDHRTFFPFDGFLFYPLFDNLWIEKFYQVVCELENKNISEADILKSLPTFSSLKFNFFEMLFMLNDANMDHEKSRKIINFFLQYIRHISVDEKWYNHDRIQKYINIEHKKELAIFKKEDAPIVGKIICGCAALVHGLYNDYCTDFGYDVFGPYDVSKKFGKGSELFIKYFPDLKAELIWPERKGKKIDDIVIYQVLKNIKSKSYYMGSHIDYKNNIIENTICARVDVNGRSVKNKKKLHEISEMLLDDAAFHYNMCKEFDFEKQKEIYLLQFCYQFKKLFELAGISWRPSKEMKSAIRGKKLIKGSNFGKFNYDQSKEYFGINYLKKVI